jgi:D-glycerate 3-kinase
LKARQPVKIPVYDKSQFNGQGDRANESTWEEVNKADDSSVDVVVFEGWCVGFRPLSDSEVEEKWNQARDGSLGNTQLGKHRLQDLLFVNRALRGYDALTE